MTETPEPQPIGRGKTIGFLIGGLVLVAAVATAYFADGGSAGRGIMPPPPAAASAP